MEDGLGLALQLLRQVKFSAPQQACSLTFRPYALCFNSLFLKQGNFFFLPLRISGRINTLRMQDIQIWRWCELYSPEMDGCWMEAKPSVSRISERFIILVFTQGTAAWRKCDLEILCLLVWLPQCSVKKNPVDWPKPAQFSASFWGPNMGLLLWPIPSCTVG